MTSALHVINEYQRSGASHQQAATRWPRERWVSWFPSDTELLTGLPDLLTRDDVRAQSEFAGRSATDARRAFIAQMVWGYGNVGYGPYRTDRVLRNPRASELLRDAAVVLNSAGTLEAYRSLGDRSRNRLAYLGPAFGTKFLYFCPQSAVGPSALILDQVLATALQRHGLGTFNPVPWAHTTYERYLDLMGSLSAQTGVASDGVEEALFIEQSTINGTQWGLASG